MLSGGLAGYAAYVYDVEIGGSGQISASGGNALAAGLAAALSEQANRVVISGVSLSGGAVAGGVAVLSARDSAEATDLYVALSLGDDVPALVGTLTEGSTLARARYLSGVAIGAGDGASVSDAATLPSVDAFGEAALYGAFDGEIWNRAGGELPSLK